MAAIVMVVAATLVAFEAPAQANAAGSSCGANINPIVCENQKPGTDPNVWDIDGAGDDSIQGFATDISVNAGSKIDFKIDTKARAYTIDIYRTGWYQGLGARKITSVTPSATLPQTQPQCISDVSTELYDCGNWGVSASWNVPSDAVSGVYVAKLTRTDTGGASHIIFIVRNDGNHSDVLFQTSDPTWQAYNTYGGSDFYQGAANGRAYKISYNRPIVTRGGYEERSFYFSAEYATVRFLERNGYDMSYIAGVDTDRRGGELLNHNVFLSVGHDEYWSGEQRANIEAARDDGVNIQFLSGNTGYWRTRYEQSATGSSTDYRTLVSYKETWSNAKIDPSSEWTGTWRDPRFANASQGGALPENSLIGTLWTVNLDDLALTVTAAEGKTRLWRNAGLSNLSAGTKATLAPHTVGYESDEDVDNGFRPAGLIRLSTTVGDAPEYLTDYGNTLIESTTEHHVTLYRATSGALVFSAASIQWGWGLDETHDANGAPADVRMQQAQVNLLADMGAQPSTLMSTLVAATKSTDTTAPTTTITSPAAGAQIVHGSTVTVTGTASDVGGVVAGVEVSVDDGATWHVATGTTSWSYTYIQQGASSATIKARAIDDSANFSQAGVTRSVTVSGPWSVFGQETPAVAAADDGSSVELGLRFTPQTDGFVTGIRFYKGAGNVGTHVGSLWSSTGQRMATVTFTNETQSGWQTAQFDTPVEAYGGTTYTVSYSAPQGHYAITELYWPYKAKATAPLSVSTSGGQQNAGTYGSLGAFPSQTFRDANYYVDVVFEKSDTSPLRISARTPAANESSVALETAVTATFTRAADPASVSLTVKDADGATVAGTVTYDVPTKTVRFVAAQPYSASTRYTVDPTARDADGIALADGSSWSFRTKEVELPEGVCPCSLFTSAAQPDIASHPDNSLVTLGVRFSVETSGKITELKFYKGPSNFGAHTGALWRADGTRLASVNFTDESATGWQIAKLDTPVTVNPGETYIASYLAPQGGFAVGIGQLSSGLTRGPLTVPANGGAFTYSSGFPDNTSPSNYFVDVTFERTQAGPTVVSTNPAGGSHFVAVTSTISATFDQALATGFTGTVTANGANVAGAWTLSSNGRTATFQPSAALPASTTVNVSLRSIVGTNGNAGADLQWSFTTAEAGQSDVVTFFGGLTPQVSAATQDTSSIELGLAFSPKVDGEIVAVRFYKGVSNVGTHVGSLWDSKGVRLAQVTFSAETSSGWQRAEFAQPVRVVAGATYTVSYLAPNGNYSYTSAALTTAVANDSLATVGENGRYRYGTGGGAPTDSWNATNYFVDVEFVATAPPAAVVQTLFTDEVPEGSDADTSPLELGTAFTITKPGKATAIRFYKATGSAGIHVGTLWSSDGAVLARVTFANESAAGWQRAELSTPVQLQANETYVVSYFAPAGGYVVTRDFFAAPKQSGYIVGIPDDNGRFVYGANGGFPTSSVRSSAYFVDAEIEFESDPALVRTTPASGATGVDPAPAVISATLANASTGAITVANGSTPVAGSSSFNASTGVVTFTPVAALARGTTYTVTVTANGAAVTGGVWSFTTLANPAITARTPASSATSVLVDTAITATISNASTAAITMTSNGSSVAGTSSFNASTGVVTFTPTSALAWSRTYSVTATANGAALAGGTWSFTTIAQASRSSSSPAASATGVLVNASITATLSSGAQAGAITLKQGITDVAGTSTYNSSTRVVTFVPTTVLDWSKSYTATVTANGGVVSSGSWSFTTIAQASRSSSSPAANATGVLVNASITATLSSGAQAGAITLAQGTTNVAGTSTYNSSTRIVTFVPTTTLDWSKSYTATVTANGGAVSSGSWSFTTIAQASLSSSSPAANATSVIATGLSITATLSSGAQAGAITLKQGTTNVAGTSTYNSSTRIVTFVPSAALGWSKTYTATITANGGAVSIGTWSFTTAGTPVSLFTTGTPTNANQSAGQAYQVGTRFKTSAAGVVTAISYYKGNQNTGTHTGYLRSASGSVLGQVTFSNETTSGWQTATLSTPVRLTANTEYRVTFYSSSGRYALTTGGLASAVTSGVLSTIATGGLSGNGTANPTTTSTNKYWVDVVFVPDN